MVYRDRSAAGVLRHEGGSIACMTWPRHRSLPARSPGRVVEVECPSQSPHHRRQSRYRLNVQQDIAVRGRAEGGVYAALAFQGVGHAVERVEELVVAATTDGGVGAFAGVKRIGVGVAEEGVIAEIPAQAVVAVA